MIYTTKSVVKYDFLIIGLYFVLITCGWLSIYSSTHSEGSLLFQFEGIHGKQLLWMLLSLGLIFVLLNIEAKFYERFSSIIYVVGILGLALLFVFGKKISGATSWYSFGSFSLQPTEFAKFATALALSKWVSQMNVSLKRLKHVIISFVLLGIPAVLIIAQPDPGSALVYACFLIPMYREGLSFWWIFSGFALAILFISTLYFGIIPVIIFCFIALLLHFVFINKKRKYRFQKPPSKLYYIVLFLFCATFLSSTDYIFEEILEDRHRDRINLVLGKIEDTQGKGYNTMQSVIAIGSGGLTGKGFLQGTQTKGGFVPEQETDYIFTNIGEEWGFLGSMFVVLLFCVFIIRLCIIAERQKTVFTRVYAYSVASIFFFHFLINIGMVIGIFPTIGIPLPFFSYGGSSLWGFTILLFILVKLDSSRLEA
ncbi:MAG: rod shape-determining protein RodA [Flavobacteriaceae bacterium]|nr:rod shape-determining protein RodA [Flavobacteriaceae bacterium]